MTRALKTKNILKSLLKGLTTTARSEKYVDSLGNASSGCTSKYLHGEVSSITYFVLPINKL